MKTTLLSMDADASNLAVLPCPTRGTVKLVAFNGSITGSGQGDQVLLVYRRGTQAIMRAAAPPHFSSILDINGFIGAASFDMLVQDSFVVATGVSVYNVTPRLNLMSLPNLAWPWDVTVRLTVGAGAIAAVTYWFEQTAP